MQKLHLVGFTTDQRGLIFSTRRGAKSGGFVVPVDDTVLAAVDELRAQIESDAAGGMAAEPAPDRPESALSVREVQSRLRAGRSINEVAADARVDTEWVVRFAAPVLAEQAEMVRTVRAATFTKPRLGPSALPLGDSVYRNLADKGVNSIEDELERGWSARQLVDGVWLVGFAYRSRGRKQLAEWEIEEGTWEIKARNRLASQLAYRSPPVRPQPAKATGEAEGVARRAAALRRADTVRLVAAAKEAARRDVAAAQRAQVTRERETREQEATREAERKERARAVAKAAAEIERKRKTRKRAAKQAASAQKRAAAAAAAEQPGKKLTAERDARRRRASSTTTAPARSARAKATIAKATPAKSQPAKATPAKATPAKSQPAKATPAKATPAKAQPAKPTAAKATPAKRRPAKRARQTAKAQAPKKAIVGKAPAAPQPDAATPRRRLATAAPRRVAAPARKRPVVAKKAPLARRSAAAKAQAGALLAAEATTEAPVEPQRTAAVKRTRPGANGPGATGTERQAEPVIRAARASRTGDSETEGSPPDRASAPNGGSRRTRRVRPLRAR